MEGFGGPISLFLSLSLCACPYLTLVSEAEEMWGEREGGSYIMGLYVCSYKHVCVWGGG